MKFDYMQIDAHRSPLAAMVLSFNGMYMATASEQGTIVRVHLISDATKVTLIKCILGLWTDICFLVSTFLCSNSQ